MLNSHLSALFSTTLMLQATISISLSFMLFLLHCCFISTFSNYFRVKCSELCCCISSCLFFALSSRIYLCSFFV